jgi:autoinducer 2-degrading protein
MYIAHVFVHVKPNQINAFKTASLENARESLKEPGIARFDVIQQSDDPARFVLLEVYRTQADTNAHKESAHYQRWREAIEPMQAEPRSKIVYQNIYPDEQGWDSRHAL